MLRAGTARAPAASAFQSRGKELRPERIHSLLTLQLITANRIVKELRPAKPACLKQGPTLTDRSDWEALEDKITRKQQCKKLMRRRLFHSVFSRTIHHSITPPFHSANPFYFCKEPKTDFKRSVLLATGFSRMRFSSSAIVLNNPSMALLVT
jgi:hypothetical protein